VQQPTEKGFSFQAHLVVALFNIVLVFMFINYFENGSILIRDIAVLSGTPAQITLFLLSLCIVALDYVYIKNIVNQNNENI